MVCPFSEPNETFFSTAGPFFTFLLSSMGRGAPMYPSAHPGAPRTHPNTPRSGVQDGCEVEGGEVRKRRYNSSTLSGRDGIIPHDIKILRNMERYEGQKCFLRF